MPAPPSADYDRLRRAADRCDDARYGVEVTSGASFHPPKSGPSEEFQATRVPIQPTDVRRLRRLRSSRRGHSIRKRHGSFHVRH